MNREPLLRIMTVIGLTALLLGLSEAFGSVFLGFAGTVFVAAIVLGYAPRHASKRRRGRHDLSFVRVRAGPRSHEGTGKRAR